MRNIGTCFVQTCLLFVLRKHILLIFFYADSYCRELLGVIKGEIVMHVGETSTQRSVLPSSYSTDTRKFIDDTSASLDSHCKSFVAKVDEMIKEIEEQSGIWKGKLTEMKKQAEHIVSQRRRLVAELLDFKKHI